MEFSPSRSQNRPLARLYQPLGGPSTSSSSHAMGLLVRVWRQQALLALAAKSVPEAGSSPVGESIQH